MNGRIVEMDGSAHQKVQKLLPWLLAETLTGADLALVRKHLRGCEECRADLAWQRQVQAAEPAMRSTPDVERAFAALSDRLGAQAAPARPARPRQLLPDWVRQLWTGTGQWQRWAMAAQCAVIAGLAVALIKPAANDADGYKQYRALSAPASAGAGGAAHAGNVLVMFKPDTTEAQLRRILNDHGARIVDGPTVTDAYMLLLSGAGGDKPGAVAALRREPAVMMAESLAGSPSGGAGGAR
jgi:hypothetical protein